MEGIGQFTSEASTKFLQSPRSTSAGRLKAGSTMEKLSFWTSKSRINHALALFSWVLLCFRFVFVELVSLGVCFRLCALFFCRQPQFPFLFICALLKERKKLERCRISHWSLPASCVDWVRDKQTPLLLPLRLPSSIASCYVLCSFRSYGWC